MVDEEACKSTTEAMRKEVVNLFNRCYGKWMYNKLSSYIYVHLMILVILIMPQNDTPLFINVLIPAFIIIIAVDSSKFE